MECPNCQFAMTGSPAECPVCGLIFAKWRERHPDQAAAFFPNEAADPSSAPPSAPIPSEPTPSEIKVASPEIPTPAPNLESSPPSEPSPAPPPIETTESPLPEVEATSPSDVKSGSSSGSLLKALLIGVGVLLLVILGLRCFKAPFKVNSITVPEITPVPTESIIPTQEGLSPEVVAPTPSEEAVSSPAVSLSPTDAAAVLPTESPTLQALPESSPANPTHTPITTIMPELPLLATTTP